MAPAKDHTDAAVNFFSTIRTPAALLAGSALAFLWGDFCRAKGQNYVRRAKAYNVLILVTVIVEFSCIFMSTVSGVRVMGGGIGSLSVTICTVASGVTRVPCHICRGF